MPQIKVYHSPNFLEYRDRHSDIAPPVRPVATVQIPAEVSAEQSLEIAYRQTQHISRPWWDNDDVLLHVRSTSVGDMLADEQGNLFVVESVGFQMYQPRAVRPHHRLAEAYRQLDEVLGKTDTHQIITAASQTRNTILHVLESEGYLNGEVPILAWDDAQPGDPSASLRTSSGRRSQYRPFSRDSPQAAPEVAGQAATDPHSRCPNLD
jgi:hypothetical protein